MRVKLRRRDMIVALVTATLLLAIAADYAFMYPVASRKLETINGELRSLKLPPDSHEVGFWSAGKPRYVAAVLYVESGLEPKEFCRLSAITLSADGWQVVSPCGSATSDAVILRVCKGDEWGSVSYHGLRHESSNFSIGISWGPASGTCSANPKRG